jgi:hypothetical protein
MRRRRRTLRPIWRIATAKRIAATRRVSPASRTTERTKP